MTPFRSKEMIRPVRRVFGIGLIALVALPLTIGGLRTSGRIIVPAGDVVTEDLYAIGGLVSIEGTVEGDVFAVAGEVRVTGTVTGDVIALVGGPLEVSGTVGGAVRVAAVSAEVPGSITDDLAGATFETTVLGSIGRDLLLVSGDTDLYGSVGRDLLTQSVRLTVDGMVGRDVEARVDTMVLGPDADVRGDVLYRASDDASVADGATVLGQLMRRPVVAPVWARAVTRVVSILSIAGLIVAGLGAAWLFRRTSDGAVAQVERHPWRSAAVGLGALLFVPVLLIPMFLTLVGIPIGFLLLLLWVIAIVLGPIPAVTRLGQLLLRGRGGVAAALVVGAITWRAAMWLLPLVAGILYLVALLVGLGAYVSAGWELRRSHAASAQ